MKVFRTDKGRIYQITDKERMKEWDAEMPFIFIEYAKDRLIPSYPKSIKKQVDDYFKEVLNDIAIPAIERDLSSEDEEEREKAAESLQTYYPQYSKEMKKIIPKIKKFANDKNKKIAKIIKKIIEK
ncbi:MAG: hypothetical protein GF364_13940 [Candidatus Lokiarchaeota archaeon]|nr:hypothetical protein [Candidatus Lokiarchaeota archaeon]